MKLLRETDILNAVLLMNFWSYIVKWLQSLVGADLMIDAIQNGRDIPAQAWLNLVFSSITLLFGIFVGYRVIYLILGLFGRSRKYKDVEPTNKYCFLIPARNEELVIANLIDSIRQMDYPQELIDILVVADNCHENDKTAQIAREKGVFVVERHDPSKRTKGFGLEYALTEFSKTHDLEKDYFGYIVMDADNVVSTTFLRKYNSAIVNGKFDAAVAYRNAKNLPENWISAMCGMNVYVNVVTNLRARSILNTNQQVYGTSICFRSYLLKDGWHWTGLTEDLDIQADLAAKGRKVGYCEEAVFYEEEPTKVGIFIRQQMRWTKGSIHSFNQYGLKLLGSFFKKPTWGKYDMFWQVFPFSLYSFYFTLAYQLASLVLYFVFGENGYNWVSFLTWILTLFGGIYVSCLFNDLVTVIRDWKRFHLNIAKTIAYILLFPIYQIINLPISAVAAFMNVRWRHIDHHYVVDPKKLEEEEREKQKK